MNRDDAWNLWTRYNDDPSHHAVGGATIPTEFRSRYPERGVVRGFPVSSRSGFRGNRVEAHQAGMMIAEILSIFVTPVPFHKC